MTDSDVEDDSCYPFEYLSCITPILPKMDYLTAVYIVADYINQVVDESVLVDITVDDEVFDDLWVFGIRMAEPCTSEKLRKYVLDVFADAEHTLFQVWSDEATHKKVADMAHFSVLRNEVDENGGISN